MKYPRFTIIIYNKQGEVVHKYHSRRQKSVLPRLNRFFKRNYSVYIKVVYDKGFHNEGCYHTKKDAVLAWLAFTEKDLVDEFR